MTKAMLPIVRLATREDVPEILGMIKELAQFENALDKVLATEETLLKTLTFATSPDDARPEIGYAKTFLLVLPDTRNQTTEDTSQPSRGGASDEVVGMALFFNNYSTWRACPGIYLEDLYVRQPYRRRGYATILLKALAAEASRISNGIGRLEWSCLRWNKGALDFYERLGSQKMEEWVGIRVEGEGLATLANLDTEQS